MKILRIYYSKQNDSSPKPDNNNMYIIEFDNGVELELWSIEEGDEISCHILAHVIPPKDLWVQKGGIINFQTRIIDTMTYMVMNTPVTYKNELKDNDTTMKMGISVDTFIELMKMFNHEKTGNYELNER